MVRTFGRRGTTVLATLAALALTGCDSTTGPDIAAGEFEVEFSGDLEGSTSGVATHGSASDGDQETWVIALVGDDDGEGLFIYIARYGTRPPTGEYEVEDYEDSDTFADGDWVAFVTTMENGSTTFLGVATGGTVEITSSSTETLAGTFELDVVGFDPDLPDTDLTITVSGSFNAGAGVII